MEELQLEIYRLRRENSALRHRLTTTNQFMAIHVQMNTELEHKLKAVNSHFEMSLELMKGFIQTKQEGQLTTAFTRAYHLLNRN